jgi:hypothetical protein
MLELTPAASGSLAVTVRVETPPVVAAVAEVMTGGVLSYVSVTLWKGP